jgi:hypothetical protein
MDATKDQLEQLGIKQYEWERANEQEREALMMRLDLDVDIDGDGTAPESPNRAKGKDDADDANLADPDLDPVAKAEKDETDATKSKDEVKAAAAAAEEATKKKEEAADPLVPEVKPTAAEVDAAAIAATEAAAAPKAIQPPDYAKLAAFDEQLGYMPAEVDTAPAQAKIDAANAKSAALRKQIDDGELSTAEALAAKDDINAALMAANIELSRAQDRNELRRDTNVQRWNAAQDRFLNTAENKTLYEDDPAAYAMLNMFVQQIGAKLENVSRGFMSVLIEADQLARKRLGLPVERVEVAAPAPIAKPAAAPAPAPARAAKPTPRIPDTSKVPPNVGLVPQADVANDDSPYAKLDRLEGKEYEAALARLSPAARRAYIDNMNGEG